MIPNITRFIAFVLLCLPVLARAQSDFAPPKASIRYAPDRTCDLIHLSVDLQIDYKGKKIQGIAHNSMKVLRNGISSVMLHAGPELEIHRLTVNGKLCEFFRKDRELHISTGMLHKGQELMINIAYSCSSGTGKQFGKSTNGLHWILPTTNKQDRVGFWTQGESHYNSDWVPTWDYPNDFATSETRTQVPADWNVIGNGKLTSEKTSRDGKTKTYVWTMTQPHATYLLSLVGGPFDIKKDKWNDVDLIYVVPRGMGGLIDSSFGHTKDMIGFFSDTLGVKYAWPKYAQNAMYDFGGGMENVSATTLEEGGLSESREGFFEMDSLNSHELGHQWFGDLVTCRDWGDTWLNESFATFMEMIYFEHSRGKSAYDLKISEYMSEYFQEARRYKRPLSTKLYSNDDAPFDSHSYPKGGVILHTLRRFLGDENFYAGLRYYLNQWRHQPVESAQLRRAMAEATGINCDAFWAQWIEKPGHPVLEYLWNFDAGKLRLTIKQTQNTSDGTPIYDLNAKIGVISHGALKRLPIHISKLDETFELSLQDRPDALILDPDQDFLREIRNSEWSLKELPYIAQFAPSAADRSLAFRRMISNTDSQNDLDLLVKLLENDKGLSPTFNFVPSLSRIAVPKNRDFWINQLDHANFARRVIAVNALKLMPVDDKTTKALRNLVNDRAPIQVVVNAINALKAWDAKGNRDIFERAKLIKDRRDRIRRAAESALKP